jgi:predicted nucleic acid-binding protein
VTFLLDTSVAIHLRDRDPNVLEKLDALSGPFVLSVISRIELENGVYRGREVSAARRGRLDLLLSAIEVLPFDDLTADAYSAILAAVGNLDERSSIG